MHSFSFFDALLYFNGDTVVKHHQIYSGKIEVVHVTSRVVRNVKSFLNLRNSSSIPSVSFTLVVSDVLFLYFVELGEVHPSSRIFGLVDVFSVYVQPSKFR